MAENKEFTYFPLSNLLEKWKINFGKTLHRDFYWIASPGRVNLIGEHTDYHGGFVCPAAIDLKTYILASPRADQQFNCYSVNKKEKQSVDLSKVNPEDVTGWMRYVVSGGWVLREEGYPIKGADIVVMGSIPFGGGLSSSASLEVGVIQMFDLIHGLGLSKEYVAKLGQMAENRFVGVPCGIMDQFAAAACEENSALLLDCRSLETKSVKIPENWKIVVLDTGVHHELASSEYAKRQQECRVGLMAIQKNHPVELLRDADIKMLDEIKGDVDEMIYRRLLHVIGENERAVQFYYALKDENAAVAGKLMKESHLSLKDNYEVSCAELDKAVEIAGELEGLVGCRMTGGGFGGCSVNLVMVEQADKFRKQLEWKYQAYSGGKGMAFLLNPSVGVQGGNIGTIE